LLETLDASERDALYTTLHKLLSAASGRSQETTP
jgi:hypothetical protein